jgi:hypothetical protein
MAGGVDHLLFVAALALAATRSTWLLWMVLTFSLGHLSTMALAITYGWPRLAAVEFAIGATIVAAAVGAWRGGGERAGEVRDSGTSGGRLTWRRRDGVTFGAAAALAAGLVHGAAFGAELRGVLATSEGLLWPIAAFGVGLDAAQSVVALSCAGLLAAVERRLGPRRRGQLRRGLAVPIGLAGVAFAARALVAAAMA